MNELDKFGEFLIKNLRDEAIGTYLQLENNQIKDPLATKIHSLTSEDKELIKKTVVFVIDGALHDLLRALQEAHDFNEGIELEIDGKHIAGASKEMQAGMLHGELFGENGWIERFSKYRNLRSIDKE